MIRLLTKDDKQQLLDFLYQEPAYNIFPIGDVETFGFEEAFQRVYGEFDDQDQLKSMFLRYRENAVYYAYEQRFNDAYLKIFEADPFEFISGKQELLELIEPYLNFSKKQVTYFCKVSSLDGCIEDDPEIQVAKTKKDYAKIYDCLKSIEEFEFHKKDKEQYINEKMMSNKMGITLFIENQNKVISTVATTAETKQSAMVVAVATDKKYRSKGFATRLMKSLIKIYLEDKKKELCLFYDNPKAGNIYISLGFTPMGKWTMYRK